jgi:hypothetical protein
MPNKTVVVKTKDSDPNTKLQDIMGWHQNNVPVISIIDEPAKIKVNNGTQIIVDDAIIKAANGQEYYYIANGTHKGKYVKREDVA